MIRPVTSSKVLLVADRRDASLPTPAGPLRRFRLARLRVDSQAEPAKSEGGPLTRICD